MLPCCRIWVSPCAKRLKGSRSPRVRRRLGSSAAHAETPAGGSVGLAASPSFRGAPRTSRKRACVTGKRALRSALRSSRPWILPRAGRMVARMAVLEDTEWITQREVVAPLLSVLGACEDCDTIEDSKEFIRTE